MQEEQKQEVVNYLEKASLVILGLLFILFPITFTNLTADFYNLPKQAFVVFVTLAVMLMLGIKTLLLGKVTIRRTPFDLPLILFLLVILISSLFSSARINALANVIPVILAGIAYFGIVYNAKNEKSVLVLISSLLGGAVLLSLVAVFTFFKVYIFPFEFAKTASFTPLGAILDQAIYLLFVLPVGLYFLVPYLFKKRQALVKADFAKLTGFAVASLIILVGLTVSIYNLMNTPNALAILPIETGFQTAFAAISQDTGRVLQGFLFGTGFGEYLIDFTRFKQTTFNLNPTLWTFSFTRSSTFVLELLATTGVLGLLSFLFLCYKVIKERPYFVPLIIALITSFLLPFSFATLVLVFFILAIYAILRGLTGDQKYFDVELQLVAFKKGLITFSPEGTRQRGYEKALSYSVFGVILILVIVLGFLAFDYLSASIAFERSLVAASQNNGELTYNNQNAALSSFTGKYNDAYYRIFSQTNLSLANSLASSVPAGATVSAQTQQTIYTLVQQSINTGRQATTLSPLNTLNWQNLSAIYRGLVGFGQNADSFAILSQQQAIQLDPVNPQNYIVLGGIYYQLGQWDNALAQFQQAASLKPDLANAYYNIGHTYVQKGDQKNALAAFQTVKSLVANDPTNLKKIDEEIQSLEAQTTPAQTSNLAAPEATSLPSQNPPVKIPAPANTTISPTPSATSSSTPTP